MQHDIEIPQRFGIRQPIGDSVGPGGIMRALRSVPVLLDIARDVDAVAPDAWLVNVTNPLTALCRSVTRETNVKTVGLCNEWVGCTWMLSLLFDSGMHDIDPILGGVNHYPLATSLRVAGEDDGFVRLHALLNDPERCATEPIWMDPPERAGWVKVSPAEYWTKLDVIENNRVRFELFRRFGVLVGSGDHHSVEFMPGFVHAGNEYGARLARPSLRDARPPARCRRRRRVLRGDARRARRDSDAVGRARRATARRDGRRQAAVPPGQPAQRGQRHQPRLGAVVEIMGVADGAGVRGRDKTTVPGIMGEFLRRINVVQEWTVEAAVAGDRELVLEAMLADPIAAQLPYERIIEMTDEMLAATAEWLPRFDA